MSPLLSSPLSSPGSFSHLGIFPGTLLSTWGASHTLAGSGCSSIFLSHLSSGPDRDGTVDSKDDEAEGTNDLDKHLRKKISRIKFQFCITAPCTTTIFKILSQIEKALLFHDKRSRIYLISHCNPTLQRRTRKAVKSSMTVSAANEV